MKIMSHRKFWALALLWLPAGLVATAVVRFSPGSGAMEELMIWPVTLLTILVSLVPVAPCGLPLALGCRRLWRLGYHQAAWTAGVVLGALTVVGSLPAGLLGPIAIAMCAVVLSLPVWIAVWWLARRS